MSSLAQAPATTPAHPLDAHSEERFRALFDALLDAMRAYGAALDRGESPNPETIAEQAVTALVCGCDFDQAGAFLAADEWHRHAVRVDVGSVRHMFRGHQHLQALIDRVGKKGAA